MMFRVWLFRGVLTLLLVLSGNGCFPSGQQVDEEKEPHFLAGKNAINSMDYRGAIEEFEKALEVNPRNAKAHFELGCLYEEREGDAAAAIYHYEQFLKLRPGSDSAEVIRPRITNCKQDLAKTVLPLPITPGMQRQFDQLLDENKRLKDENAKWKEYFASRSTANPPGTLQSTTANNPPTSQPTSPTPVNAETQTNRGSTSVRTHTVQAGETLSSIARKYGVKLNALMSANPTLEPKRMRVGQVLKVPSA